MIMWVLSELLSCRLFVYRTTLTNQLILKNKGVPNLNLHYISLKLLTNPAELFV